MSVESRLEKVVKHAIQFEGDSFDHNDDFFEGSLALDSIDILEIVLVVKKEFGVEIKLNGGDENIFRNFSELRDLVESMLTEDA